MAENEYTLPDEEFTEQDVEWLTRADNWSERGKGAKARQADIVVDVLSLDLLPGALAMLRSVQKLQALRDQSRRRSGMTPSRQAALLEERKVLAESLNGFIARFDCHFVIDPFATGASRFVVDLEGAGTDDTEKMMKYIGFKYTEELLNLLATNRTDAIRKCEFCGFWIYAVREKQRFCTQTCRQRYFLSRTDVKEKRKAARRRYYENLKARDRRNLEVVMKKTRGRGLRNE